MYEVRVSVVIELQSVEFADDDDDDDDDDDVCVY